MLHACTVTGEQTDTDYLDTDDGQEYVRVFKHIRLIHILTDSGSISVINTDRIIPRGYIYFIILSYGVYLKHLAGWLLPAYEKLWNKMLLVDQRMDPG